MGERVGELGSLEVYEREAFKATSLFTCARRRGECGRAVAHARDRARKFQHLVTDIESLANYKYHSFALSELFRLS